MCASYCGACFMLVWEYIHIVCMFDRCIVGYFDCFLPPSHRNLHLAPNQLSSLPASVFAGLSALT